MFLCFGSDKLNYHVIHLDWRLISNHTSLIITIPIVKEYIQTKKQTIIKESKEEYTFIKELIEVIKLIDTDIIQDVECLVKYYFSFCQLVGAYLDKELKNSQHHKILQELVEQ